MIISNDDMDLLNKSFYCVEETINQNKSWFFGTYLEFSRFRIDIKTLTMKVPFITRLIETIFPVFKMEYQLIRIKKNTGDPRY